MHILYLHQHFALPSGTTGTRSYEFARRWVQAGHQITLICGITDQSGIEADGQKLKELTIEGIRILALNTRYSNSMGFWARVAAFVKFMVLCLWTGLKVQNVSVIFATSTPLTIGIPAMMLKWVKRVPFVFEVRDQWPEVPIEMGIIRNPVLKRLLLWLEKRIYKSAAAVVGLSPGMSRGVRQVLNGAPRQVVTAPNSSDTGLFSPVADGRAFREHLKWTDRFVILHFGAMGKANGLDFLIDAARRLADIPDILFAVVGEGREKNRLRNRVHELKLQNIQVLDSFPKHQMPEVVAACDVSTVIFANYPILEDNSANKFFDSLAAGKPVLLNYGGWQKEFIERYECGFGCPQCDLDAFVSKVRDLYANREKLQAMGTNARKLAEQEFDRDMIAQRVLSLIESVIQE